ncbi:TRAP transporter small permease [Lysinibacillus capsici]|uniref:TRAP transporter small permease n=1 Tax=Lysinibacillus capsici TaxID=2115968 RepID=UPI0034E517BE
MGKKLKKLEEHFLVLSLLAMVALIFAQIVGRYIFQSSPSWTEEAARYIHIFQVWVGASYAVKLGEHIRVGAFIELFHGTLRKTFEYVGIIIWFMFSLFLGIFGTKLVLDSLHYGQVSPAIQIPFWILFLAIPLGGFGMAFRLIEQFVKIKNTDYPRKEKVMQV